MSAESIDQQIHLDEQPHLLSNDTMQILAHQLGVPPEKVRQQELLIIKLNEESRAETTRLRVSRATLKLIASQ